MTGKMGFRLRITMGVVMVGTREAFFFFGCLPCLLS